MRKLAGLTAVAVALLACDAGNPVTPAAPGAGGGAPAPGGSSVCVGLSRTRTPSELDLKASALLRRGDRSKLLHVSVGFDAGLRQRLTAGSPTDEAIITVAFGRLGNPPEPDEPVEAVVSTTLGFLVDQVARETSADPGRRQCSLALSLRINPNRCKQFLGRSEDSEDPAETVTTCRVASLALRPGKQPGDARIIVKVAEDSLAITPLSVTIADPERPDGGG